MKRRLSDLALLGGAPAFAEPLHVGRPNIGDRERFLARVADILDRRWLTNRGEYVQEFEARVASLSGVRHAVATCNGTVALEIAIRALDLTGEVIVPAFTFIATAHALEWQGIRPVFADIDPRTHLVDPDSVRRLIGPRTTGIIGVHVWGQVCPVDELAAIARRHGLRLLFDAAHALGCGTRDRRVGSCGDLEVFSFHATKFVNSAEGGAIVTNDDELAAKMRLMKNFGFLGYDNVGYIGTNGKMSEFNAAMGLTSIEAMDAFIAINERHLGTYQRELGDLPGVRLLTYPADQRQNFQYVVAEVDGTVSPVPRDRLLDVLWAENIRARRYFYPGCHRMEPYRSRPEGPPDLRITERVAGQVLVLPTGQAMSDEDVRTVAGVLRLAVVEGHGLSNAPDEAVHAHADVDAR